VLRVVNTAVSATISLALLLLLAIAVTLWVLALGRDAV
jgi:uncharacterized protein with PQ loop repeat